MDKRKFKNFKSAAGMASKRLAFPLCLLLSLSACQSTQQAEAKAESLPAWTSQQPSSEYLVYGVGSASHITNPTEAKLAAQESARLAIAKQLNVEIEGTTTVAQSQANGDFSYQVDEILYSKVPSIKLQGINIEDEFYSQQSNTAYALASFNKVESRMHAELDIRQLDEEITGARISGLSKSERLKEAMAIKRLVAKRRKANDYHRQLGGGSIATPRSVTDKDKMLNDFIQSVTFSISTQFWGQESIRNQLAESLTSQGLTVVGEGQAADFQIDFSVDFNDVKKNNTYYVFANSSLKLLENSKEKAHVSAQVKAASSFENMAKSNAEEKAAKILSKKLAMLIIDSKI
ncbi:LPP20 family lipoprotein [Pseudoalteromonas piscicida]|nr:LPP20 family lipoprotein [Pseudoalteromonas piscicida]